MARVSHHPDQTEPEAGGQFRYQILGDQHAAPLFAAIDFDQCLDVGRMRGDRVGRQRVVGDDGHIGAAGVQPRDLIELSWRDSNSVENVSNAMAGEILRLGEGRDGDATRLTRQHQPRDIDRLGGFHVRPQRHFMARQAASHGADVAVQNLAIDHQARCRQVGELHDCGIFEVNDFEAVVIRTNSRIPYG